jgi:ribosomal protein S18 acetylase RimI-like enzyme
MEIRAFEADDEASVVALWSRCGLLSKLNDPRKDIARKLRVQPGLFLVGVVARRVVATVMAGYEGHRGWINYLAVAPEHQGVGYGRAMMERAENCLRAMGCPKINLQVRRNNSDVVAFYSSIGYTEDDVVSMGKRLEHDDAARQGDSVDEGRSS